MKGKPGLISLLLLHAMFGVSHAQDSASPGDSVLLTGTVLNIYGQPVEGVSLDLIQTDADPVITDSTGTFELPAPAGANSILVSSLDYTDKRILAEGQEDLLLYLTPTGLTSGYQEADLGDRTLPLRNATSPLGMVRDGEMKYVHGVTSAAQRLKGAMPGVLSTSFSGMPGSGNYLSVRGMRSLFTNNQPLVLVDDVPLEVPGTLISRISGNDIDPLSSINPLDISSITVIKDAGLAAYYGLQASNGAIIIRTLNPTATQTTVDFMFRAGISGTPRRLPQLDDNQFKVLANEVLATSSLYEEEYQQLYPGLYLRPEELGYDPYQHNTRWQKEIFAPGTSTEANLLVKGGDEISRYGLSVGYLDEGGSIANSGFTAYNIRFTSYLNVYQWLEMNVNASLNNNQSDLYASALEEVSNPILNSLFKSPLLFPYKYDDNGNRLQTISDIREFGVSNPTAIVNSTRSEHVNTRFMSSIHLRADITEHLDFNARVGLNLNSLKEQIFRPENGMADYFEGLASSYSEANTNKFNSIFSSHYFTYRRTLGDLHQISGNAGFRIRRDRLEHDWGRAVNLPSNDQFSELQSGDNSLGKMGGYSHAYNAFATYAGGEYLFRDRYALNASVSFDFSSYNGKDNPSLIRIGKAPMALLYSAGAGWRLSAEPFMRPLSWLENAFIRVSYAMTGNDDLGNVNALDYYVQVRYRESTGMVPGTVPNTRLKHEDSRQINLGLDLSFLGDRIMLAFDHFRIATSDLLFFEPQEAYIGYLSRPENGGSILNTGLEASAFARVVGAADWTWDISGNVTFLENRVNDLATDIITPFEGGEFITREGYPAASFYGYEYLGVFRSTGETRGLVNDRGIPFGGGDAHYNDRSGPEGVADGVIDEYDKVILGSPVPEAYGQLVNRVSFRNISLDITLFFTEGVEAFNYVRYRNERMTGVENQSIKTLQRWQKEGDVTDVPRASWNDPVGNSDFSSRWIEDASYVRLKEVTLSYRIPDRFIIFRDALFFATASNVFTATPYLGYDPEFSHSFNPMEQGIDYGMMPRTRRFLIGVKLGL